MKKKLLFFLFVTFVIKISAQFTSNGVNYVIEGNTFAKVVSTCYEGNLTLPTSVNFQGTTYPVRKIASNAFDNCQDITGITIPNTVFSIGKEAFINCKNLTYANINAEINTLSDETFWGCSILSSVTLPDELQNIEIRAFENCTSLEEIALPQELKRINSYAFNNTGLKSINIPSSLQQEDNQLPPFGSNVFANTKFTEFTIPSFFEFVPSGFLSGNTELVTVNFSDGLQFISSNAFSGCSKLTNVSLPSSVTEIFNEAFAGCKAITQINLPENLNRLSEEAFTQSGLTSITIPENITQIEDRVFSDCFDLTSVTLGNNITKIGIQAFKRSFKLENINFPTALTEIEFGAFESCFKLREVNLPESLTTIQDFAFSKSGLRNITFPDAVTTISSNILFDCRSLETITLHDNITTIETNAFANNTKLIKVIVNWQTPLPVTSDIFKDTNIANTILEIPTGTKTAYQAADVWKDFGNINVIGEDNTITQIPDVNFEQELIDKNIDSDGIINGQVLTADIENVTSLNLIFDGIKDLTGIEDFKALVELRASSNAISQIDVSKNILLEKIFLGNCNLSAIDVSKNVKLTRLDLQENALTSIDVSNNTALAYLDVSHNSLQSLDVSKNTNLIILRAFVNQITSIDLTTSTSLESISLSRNNLTSLDVSKFTKLTYLDITSNQISSIDVSNNIQLKSLYAGNNKLTNFNVDNNINLVNIGAAINMLTSIDVSKQPKLERLDVRENAITSLDVYANRNLKTLDCSDNNIETLYLSSNPNLKEIFVKNNNLIELNLRNVTIPPILNDFNSSGNPNLTCVKVDNPDVWKSTYNNTGLISVQTSFEKQCTYTYTAIPDAAFEQYLIDQNIDSEAVLDGKVLTVDIQNIGELNIAEKNITNITGIESFTNLRKLYLEKNAIQKIDISNNVVLEELYAYQNQLISLDVSKNTKLTILQVNQNQLSALDVTKLTELKTLIGFNNQITEINVDNAPDLEIISVGQNQLSALNLSQNLKLTTLICEQNAITILDVTNNPLLTRIICNDNALQVLNVQNGNNTNITNENFSAFANSSLGCIQVDDVNYSNANWAQIDMGSSFKINCNDLTYVPDDNFENFLETNNLGNGIANDNFVDKNKVKSITTLDISDKNIFDVTGIEDFIELVSFTAKNNFIAQINISENTKLEEFLLPNNQINTIDFSNNIVLKNIDVGENNLSTIAVHFLTNLESLSVYKNQLSTINLYSNKNLLAFIANNNRLKNVDIRENDKLFRIDVDDNQLDALTIKNGNNSIITQFSATGNPNLACIEVDDVVFSTSKWSNNIDNTASFSTDCAPPNDDCANAIPLIFGQVTPGDVISGTVSTSAPPCANGNIISDVWYHIIVPNTGELSVQSTGVGGNLKFALYDDCQNQAGTLLACGETISLTGLTVGDQLFMRVWLEGFSGKNQNTTNGSFTFTASESSVLSVDENVIIKNRLILYPNPASNEITIKSLAQGSINSIEIYTLLGKKVFTKKGNFLNNVSVDISQLTTGVYFVKTKIDNEVISKKLVVK